MSNAPLPLIHPHTSWEEIAQLCARFSTPECECYAEIRFVNGTPFAALVREPPSSELPALLRRQAG